MPSEAQVAFDSILGPADYSEVNAAILEAESLNRALYTEDSLDAVDEAVSAVVWGLDITQQLVVDSFAEAIYTAIGGLVEINPGYVPITYISINATPLMSIPRNSIQTFTVTLNPGALDDGIVWTVNNSTFATVKGGGVIVILNKTGMLILTATDPVSGLFCIMPLMVV